MSPTLLTFFTNSPVEVALFLALLIALVENALPVLTRRYRALSPTGPTQLISRENAPLVDASAQAGFEVGHIAGTRQVALSRFDPEHKALTNVSDLPVAVMCKTGQRSLGRNPQGLRRKFAAACGVSPAGSAYGDLLSVGGACVRGWTELAGAPTAVRMPCRMRVGVGGHPGTATSTGSTADTGPSVA